MRKPKTPQERLLQVAKAAELCLSLSSCEWEQSVRKALIKAIKAVEKENKL